MNDRAGADLKPAQLLEGIGAAVGRLELLVNYNTRQVSGFAAEVREALAFAGYHKADTEDLRVFAARARKKGLL
jgi:hypothetical protein